MLITENSKNKQYKEMLDVLGEFIQSIFGITLDMTKGFIGVTNDLSAQLKKHRKPAKNADREKRIVRNDRPTRWRSRPWSRGVLEGGNGYEGGQEATGHRGPVASRCGRFRRAEG